MAGLKTKSEQLRQSLLTKNYFKPTNVYDLNTDIVTKTLNTLNAAGYDLRTNLLANTIERAVDNTALVNIGYQRLAIEMGRRVANNITNDFQVNPNAIFDKNPDTKFISKRTDYSITPRQNQTNNTLGKILNVVEQKLGAIDTSARDLFNQKEAKVGKKFYYDNLGAGQKQQLNTLIQYNYYGNWVKPNTTILSDNAIDNRLNTYVDARTKPNDGQSQSYIYGNYDTAIDRDLFAENRYNDSQNGDAPLGFSSTITSGDMSRKALDEYEFGRTSVEKDSNTTPEQYRTKNTDLVWGDDTTFPANAKRGLLYYTRNILKTDTTASDLINQENKSYVVGNTLVYKGTKCRSWTVKDQYDQFSKLIRYNGNGNEYSVLKDSVFTHQYPRINDGQADKRRYMFSIENLAWTDENLQEFGIPECERGSFGGRLMWFPFYGIEFSESAGADIETNKFLGRIEPVYSYAGTERTGSLTFMLIMDYPETIAGFAGSESQYFQNCDNIAGINPSSLVLTNTQTVGDKILEQTDTSPKEIVNNITEPSLYPVYYFENDIFDIDLTYENTPQFTACTTPLNETFVNEVLDFSNFIISNDPKEMKFRIDGYASQLTNSLYNVRLGYKRSYNLLLYIQDIINSNAQTEQQKINLTPTQNFISADFTEKNLTDLNKTAVIFKDQVRNITFELYSYGESVANQVGASASFIDECVVKKDRKAQVSKITIIPKDNSVTLSAIPAPTAQEIVNKTNDDLDKSTANTDIIDNTCTPFQEYNETTQFPLDFEKLKYFRPAYHSQTPENFHKRLTFLQQLVRPGTTINYDSAANDQNFTQGKNSIFGRMPVCVLRLGDFYHTKIIISNISFSYRNTWDLNPEGMGVQPMIAEITLDFKIIGGQSMQTYVDRLQRAVDFNFYANSSYYGNGYYGTSSETVDPNNPDRTILTGNGPKFQESEQIRRQNSNAK